MFDVARHGPSIGPGSQPFFRPDGGHDGVIYLAEGLRFVAILVVVAAVVFLVLRLLAERHRLPPALWPPRSAALDELDMLYARGNIDRAEFLSRRADLLSVAGGGSYAPAQPPPAGVAPPPPPKV